MNSRDEKGKQEKDVMMTYTVKCNGGYRIYDGEFNSIEEACKHAKSVFRLHADSGGNGSGYIASQIPRIDAEVDEIQKRGHGTIDTIPGGGSGQMSWTIKKSWW